MSNVLCSVNFSVPRRIVIADIVDIALSVVFSEFCMTNIVLTKNNLDFWWRRQLFIFISLNLLRISGKIINLLVLNYQNNVLGIFSGY